MTRPSFFLPAYDIDQLRYNYRVTSISSEVRPLYQRVIDHRHLSNDATSHHPGHHRSRHCAGSATNCVLGKECLVGGFAGLESPRKGELGADAFDAVSRVHVLDKGDLVASCGALTRNDGGVGKEIFPDLFVLDAIRKRSGDQTYSVPSVAILRHDLLLVGEPVPIPSP